TGARLADAVQRLEGAAEARVRRRGDALARGRTSLFAAAISSEGLRLTEHQAQDPLRAEAKAVRGHVSRLLRQGPAAALHRRARRRASPGGVALPPLAPARADG